MSDRLSDDPEPERRRRRGTMRRVGDLLPETAERLGLSAELRRARVVATFEAIVGEHAPAAHGACRALRIDGAALVVEADAPIVAQELRLRARTLLGALRSTPVGGGVEELRVTVRPR